MAIGYKVSKRRFERRGGNVLCLGIFVSTIPKNFQSVIDKTMFLAVQFTDAGYDIYIVGGPVRDGFVKRPYGENTQAPDIDLTTNAKPEDTERILSKFADAMWSQGKRFGTIGALHNGQKFEITTHRSESYSSASRHPNVAFGNDIEEDLARRDFTVNAMAIKLPEIKLIDPFGGLEDLLQHKILKTPIDAGESFSDDPLRMLRAARFSCGYKLTPVDDLIEAVQGMYERLKIVSAERIRDEFNLLITLPDPQLGLWFILKNKLAEVFLPELPALSLEQDPIHKHKDVLSHTVAVVAKTPPDLVLRLAALLHDIGKPKTRSISQSGVSFHHHDIVGAKMARKRLEALRYSNDQIEQVYKLIALHLRFHTYKMGWTESAIRRYARDAGDLLEKLNALTRADCTTRNKAKADALMASIDEFEDRYEELKAREELDAIRPELDGIEVMAELALAPGPMVGKAMSYLLEIRLEEGLLGKDEARARLRDWYRVNQITEK